MLASGIVVGVDGSASGADAVRWAAQEAAARGHELVVVHAYDWRVIGARAQVAGLYAESAKSLAQEVVQLAVAQARAASPGITVRAETVLGGPVPVLLRATEKAELTVIGSRGHGGFASLLLGSVSQQVATHASGPVVVVRGRTNITGGPVVVGVDGSDGSDAALRAAFEAATARGAGIVAIRAYRPADPPWGMDVPPYVEDRDARRRAEHVALNEQVAPWREKYPDVDVETVAIDGHAAQVLTGVSARAQLVVVGTRGHGGFTGLLLGSVGLRLLHHAECPVLIARVSLASNRTLTEGE